MISINKDKDIFPPANIPVAPVATPNVTPAVQQPVTEQKIVTPQAEEFVYQPKPRISKSKISRIVVAFIVLLLIIVPALFIVVKYNPFNRGVANTSGEIVWWSLGYDEKVLNEMVKDYVSANPKAKISVVVQSEIDYRERLTNSLKEGRGPDIFTIHNSWVPMFAGQLDVLPGSIYSKEEYNKVFYPIVVSNLSTSDGIVGIPLEYDALTLYINDDVFSFSGKTVPRTWDQFKLLASELTTKDTKGFILQSGAAMGLTDNVDYWPEVVALLMLQNKTNLSFPSGKESYEAIAFFSDFFGVEKIWNTTLPKSTIAFAEGKAAMYFAPARAIGEIKKLNPNLKFRTVVLPQVRKDDPNEPEISYATYWVQSVSKKTNDRELAWDFLKYMSSSASLEKMNTLSVGFGLQSRAYPRQDMRDKQINDRALGSVVALAPAATSWYLADKTNDGAEGINSLFNAAYKKSVDLMSTRRGGGDPVPFFKALQVELDKILFKYNISK